MQTTSARRSNGSRTGNGRSGSARRQRCGYFDGRMIVLHVVDRRGTGIDTAIARRFGHVDHHGREEAVHVERRPRRRHLRQRQARSDSGGGDAGEIHTARRFGLIKLILGPHALLRHFAEEVVERGKLVHRTSRAGPRYHCLVDKDRCRRCLGHLSHLGRR